MSVFTSFSGKTRHLATDSVRKAEFNEIPIISLALPKDEIISKLHDACTRVGFFYISDHDVPQEVINDIFECARSFFGLDEKEKMKVHFKKSKALRGYEPMAAVATDENKKKDLNEAYSWGYESDMDPLNDGSEVGDETVHEMSGPNSWPDVAGFQPTVAAYYGQVLTLARRLVRLFAIVLQLPETYFDSMVRRPGAMAKMLHYPSQSPSQSAALGIGSHTDIECFTILAQGIQPALQILNTKGEWIEAPPIPGTFVVNIGDMLSRWSNDVFISTVHRVLNITGEERYSIPFFFGPSYDTVIEPLETCREEGKAANYEKVVAGDYLWDRLAISRLTDEERKASSLNKVAKSPVIA